MKKNVLYLIILASILMLVGWTQTGDVTDTQESIVIVSSSYPRMEVPDYPADGKFFSEMYLGHAPSGAHFEALDYRLDAEFFNEWYQDSLRLTPERGIPDYPLDGKLFLDQYVAQP
jgi:hypothetical protein